MGEEEAGQETGGRRQEAGGGTQRRGAGLKKKGRPRRAAHVAGNGKGALDARGQGNRHRKAGRDVEKLNHDSMKVEGWKRFAGSGAGSDTVPARRVNPAKGHCPFRQGSVKVVVVPRNLSLSSFS